MTDSDTLPPTDEQPDVAELDLPGPDDPVAWTYVTPQTDVVGPDGVRIGTVDAMLGTETEGIFHGIAVRPAGGGEPRMVVADAVRRLTPSRVEVTLDAAGLERAEPYVPVDTIES